MLVQAGGGVRSVAAAEALFAAGATRVVMGTAAVESPGMVDELAAGHPDGIVVGLDAHGDDLAVRGWTERSGRSLTDLAARFEASGVAALVVTEIARDGTMEGPSLDQLRAVLGATVMPVVASGGVGSLGDLEALAALRAGDRRLDGAIVGRALYEGRFTLGEALRAADSLW
jgi:phosphoribosylformimino-5-aminoimidazole carboxamide ribotide isomerase